MTAVNGAAPLSTASSSTRPSRENSASVRNRSRERSGVFLDRPAGIEALGHQAPALAQPVHVRQDLDGLVRGDRAVEQILVELDDMAALDGLERQPAEGRQDVVVEHAENPQLRPRLEPHRGMLFEIAFGKVGHRRAAVEPGGERQGYRILARPDARDDEGPPAGGPDRH